MTWSSEPTAVVDEGALIGDGTRLWHQVHVRSTARIGAGCSLGKNVYVDADVVLGDGVKVQNNVSIYQGVTVEDEVFLGPSCVFTNDRHPRATSSEWEVVPTLIRAGASIGANATIVCGITIGPWATVGAGSVVTHDVAAHQLVIGNPARPAGWVCRCGRVVSRDPEPIDGPVVCADCAEDQG